jgi:hypothetical protein
MVSEFAALGIGALEPFEIEAAVKIWGEAGLLRPWNDPRQDIRVALESPASTVLAGRLDRILAATAMVGFDGHRGWVYYVAVDPRFRRRGFGAAMMGAAEAWLKARGAPKLELMVRAENHTVVGFYEALGYKKSDAIVMQRVLE